MLTVGVDLGTSRVRAAAVSEGTPNVVQFGDGSHFMPAAVAFEKDSVRVGRSETFVNAVVALLVALSYYLLSEMAKAVKDPAFRPDLLVWLPNLVVLALAVVLLRRASRH